LTFLSGLGFLEPDAGLLEDQLEEVRLLLDGPVQRNLLSLVLMAAMRLLLLASMSLRAARRWASDSSLGGEALCWSVAMMGRVVATATLGGV
jgi:hypothetical protein